MAICLAKWMNPRHAATLALVGWYLIVPPLTSREPRAVDIKAPFSTWEAQSLFETQQGCLEAKSDIVDRVARKALATASANTCQDCYAQCIATDDPRLKEK